MNKDDFLKIFSEIIKVKVDQITGDEALGMTPTWDSFAHVEIMLLLEKEFQIEINEKTMNQFINLNRILQLVN